MPKLGVFTQQAGKEWFANKPVGFFIVFINPVFGCKDQLIADVKYIDEDIRREPFIRSIKIYRADAGCGIIKHDFINTFITMRNPQRAVTILFHNA